MSEKRLPEELLTQLSNVPLFDRAAFISAHQQEAPTSIRLNPAKKAGGNLILERPIPWSRNGYYLSQRPSFTADPAFHTGSYYVQEASSQFLDHIIAHLQEQYGCPRRVLDLCAAPGGKSTLLAGTLPHSTLIISNEAIRGRAQILTDNMVRWGQNNTWVSANDPRSFGRMGAYFDWVVADMPCSGSGMFRKNHQAIEEWSPALVSLCAARQQRITHDVWDVLHQDGFFIYATCSYSPAENEEMLDYIADHFDVATISISLPEEWNIVTTLSPKHALKGYRFFPDKTQGEGFYIAVLQKKESSSVALFTGLPEQANKKIQEQAALYFDHPELNIYPNDHKQFLAVQAQHSADLALLRQHLYLRKAGINLGQPSHKEWIPEHDVALSIDRSKGLRTIELSKEQAWQFLKKDELQLDAEKGWYIVTYQGEGLGWIKILSNRVNNNLPKSWRIRMDLQSYTDE